MPTTVELAIELVEHDVAEQRGKRPTLIYYFLASSNPRQIFFTRPRGATG
jgi:hypothetical protein